MGLTEWIQAYLITAFHFFLCVCVPPLGVVSHVLVTANCWSEKQSTAALSLWAITALQMCCIQVSVSTPFSISVNFIKVSRVQHIDHKPRVGINGLKLIVQLHACRGVINPTGIKKRKELQPPLLVLSGYEYISKRVFYAKPSKPSAMMNRHHSVNLQRLEVEEELPLSFSRSHLLLSF